ncbi:MAG: FtsQ-type POTRA domain-containing protein [Anaerolineae bacterium]|nr:FtsQ-type POTRA domain-containing protein [Anaerolineae bacterium]
MKTRRRPSRRDSKSRGHARPAAEPDARDLPAGDPDAPQRMTPLSHVRATGDMSLAQRRAARRTRKQRAPAQRMPSAARRRRSRAAYLLSWRVVSGLIVIGLSVVLYLFLTADAFFVSSVAIGGEKYLERGEIFRDSAVAQQHILRIDPENVEKRLEEVPNIADAQVMVGWPPDMVQIVVTEREPALTWEQGVRAWVDVNGIVMKQREDRPDLLRIVAQNAEEPIDPGSRIPQTIVDGALLMRSRHPNIDVLLYDPLKGLGYHDGNGWTVWFGTGDEMDVKLLVYYRVVEAIRAQGIQPGEIVMSDPDRPYYTVLWRQGS